MFKIVKCPESTTLEVVECVDTPLGHLIHRCTRFRPSCAMKCTRNCAAALDEATRADASMPADRLLLDFDLDVALEPIS